MEPVAAAGIGSLSQKFVCIFSGYDANKTGQGISKKSQSGTFYDRTTGKQNCTTVNEILPLPTPFGNDPRF